MQQPDPFELMAGLDNLCIASGRLGPARGEMLAQQVSRSGGQEPVEQADDLARAGQVTAFRIRPVQGEAGFQEMHVGILMAILVYAGNVLEIPAIRGAQFCIDRFENGRRARQSLFRPVEGDGGFSQSIKDKGDVVEVDPIVGQTRTIRIQNASGEPVAAQGRACQCRQAHTDMVGGGVRLPAHPQGFGEDISLTPLNTDAGRFLVSGLVVERQRFAEQAVLADTAFRPEGKTGVHQPVTGFPRPALQG